MQKVDFIEKLKCLELSISSKYSWLDRVIVNFCQKGGKIGCVNGNILDVVS